MTSEDKVLVKCQKCNYPNEADKGDICHPQFSTKKPQESGVEGDILKRIYDCRNPKCKHPIAVYYYKPKPSFG